MDIISTETLKKGTGDESKKLLERIAELEAKSDSLQNECDNRGDILDLLNTGVSITEPSGRVLNVNRRMCELLGHTREEVVGRSFMEFILTDESRNDWESAARMLAGDVDSFQERREYLQKGGRTVSGLLTVSCIRDKKQNPLHLIVQLEDLTDKRMAEAALIKTQERYRILFEQSPFGALVTDTEGKILDANPEACRIAEVSKEELLQTSVLDFVEPRALDRAQEASEKLGADGIIVETVIELANGRIESVTASALDQVPPLYFITFNDITNRLHLEEQLLHSQKMKALGTLAGGIAHDMNNVLGAIMGLAELLNLGFEVGDPKQNDTQDILTACRRGRSLTTNLLGFARKGKFRRESVGLNRLANNVIEIIKHTIPKSIGVETILDENLATTMGDPGQLEQVLMNLVINAVDAMPNGGTLTVTTKTLSVADCAEVLPRKLTPGDYVRVSVRDTGVGMDRDTRHRAFEPFFTTKTTGTSSGLGLAMVYGTVSNHDGHLMLDSAPDEGATLTVLLPAEQVLSPLNQIEGQAMVTTTKKASILFVDDEAIVRRVGKRVLESLGYTVVVAGGGEEAIELYRARGRDFSVVILDLMMPPPDGSETFRRLRQIDPQCRVLLSSGFSEEEAAGDLLKKGAQAFIQKPFDLSTLRNALDQILKSEALSS